MNAPTPEEIEYMKNQVEELKKISEGNKIISDFMKDKASYKNLNIPERWDKLLNKIFPIESYDYRYSWEGLMHAIEYIENLGFPVTIKGTVCSIELKDGTEFGVDEGDKRLSTWTCIIDFIKCDLQNMKDNDDSNN